MVDYSGPFKGDINRRLITSNQSLLIISGIEKGSPAWSGLLDSMNKEFIRDLPNYLPTKKVKELKDECRRQKQIWMDDDDCNLDDQYTFQTLKLLNRFCREGLISWKQRFFLGCTVVKVSDWWYQSDEELELAKKEFSMFPEKYIPCLNPSDEVYSKSHNYTENLYNVLREESDTIEEYCRSRKWPVIPVEWIIDQLEDFREMVKDPDWTAGDWEYENALVRQFKEVRKKNPASRMRKASKADPDNYMMSTRGNNYNDSSLLRNLLFQYGWKEGIPTCLGSIFWYDSKVLPVTKDKSQIAIPGNYDYYDFGTGKKNGGNFRIFYYTSPQINMFGNVASKIISEAQNRNKYCAYQDQSRGQEGLFEAIDLIGVDSTEYSDHQTVTLLKWILETYGFAEYSESLAHSLQLPIRIVDPYKGERFLNPINGTLAGGKLDVALINDAGLVISWLAGQWIRESFDAFICGDDWIYYMMKVASRDNYLALHSLCSCFNQIVNPDKTEWLYQHKFAGFCKVLCKSKDKDLVPASGLPVNLWLKEVTSIQDISQILISLDKTRSLWWLHDKQTAEEMIDRLLSLWYEHIILAEFELGADTSGKGGIIERRISNAKKIPFSIGGLLLDESQMDMETYFLGSMDGIAKIFQEYRRTPTKIAQLIERAKLEGTFPDYLGLEMMRTLKDLISLVRDIVVLYKEWTENKLYDKSLLRDVLRRCRDLTEDYVSNSDGKSRVSTKDRTTPVRDQDAFLDAFWKPSYPVDLAIRELKRADVTLLDAIANNNDLSDMQAMYSFIAVHNKLAYYLEKGIIRSYGGCCDQYGKYYYCIWVEHNGRKKRVRLSPVVNDNNTVDGKFLPAIQIKNPELYNFVMDCRKLVGESKLDMELISVKSQVKSKIIKKLLQMRKEDRKNISLIHRVRIEQAINDAVDELG